MLMNNFHSPPLSDYSFNHLKEVGRGIVFSAMHGSLQVLFLTVVVQLEISSLNCELLTNLELPAVDWPHGLEKMRSITFPLYIIHGYCIRHYG